MSNKRKLPPPRPAPAGPSGYLGTIGDVPGEVTWTPLAMLCGCVIDWGWGGDGSVDPRRFIQWCISVLDTNCPWHGGETGQPARAPRSGVIRYQDGPHGQFYWYARRATGQDVALGNRLSRKIGELMDLAASGEGDVIALAPRYAQWARANGYEPVEAILDQRLSDLILNRNASDGGTLAHLETALAETEG